MNPELDAIDLKILRILLSDGRASYAYIAKETKLSDVAVKKRIEKLQQRGIIKRISAVVDREKLGLKYTFFAQLRVDPSEIYMVYKRLSSLPSVVEVHIVAGEYPIMVKGVGENLDELKHLIEEIGKIDGVVDVKTSVVLESNEKGIVLPSKIGQRVLG